MTDVITEFTDQEMVDWANAAIERAAEQDKRIEELKADNERLRTALQQYIDRCPMCSTGVECQDDLCYGYRLLIAGEDYDRAAQETVKPIFGDVGFPKLKRYISKESEK
jgi:hypothetical protein